MKRSGTKRAEPSTLLYVHVRTEMVRRRASMDEILADLNSIIADRGGILVANRQLLAQPIKSEWILDRFFDDSKTSNWKHPRRRWRDPQAEYFRGLLGVEHPFQFGEQRHAYGRYCVGVEVPGRYLAPTERVLGLIDAGLDGQSYYCFCHHADVVYTTAHRLVCMRCGHMHCVLANALLDANGNSWTEEQWHTAFDAKGILLDYRMQVPFIEYLDVYRAPKLWIADAWEEASGEIEFFARGDPEDIARWRASQPTAEDFLEAGWTDIPQPPTPARQIEEDGYGVDLPENAALATNAAATDFLRSETAPASLRSAVLNAFHAIELILKIKLEAAQRTATGRRLSNPQVVAALQVEGVAIAATDLALIAELRALRNKLQHSEARFGFRDTRGLLERTFVFIDKFSTDELEWWIGGVVEQPAWDALLSIDPIEVNASAWASRVVREWLADDALNSIERCPHCDRETVLRERSRAGLCTYCRRIPVQSRGPT